MNLPLWGDWQKIDEGLEYGNFALAMQSSHGNSMIDIIRIDPEEYDFELLLASENNGKKRKLDKWINDFNYIGGINAGMFQADRLTSTGYLKNYDHENNPHHHSSYNMYFVCNPKQPGLPEAQVVDRKEERADELITQYNSVLQSIRMVASGGKNIWSPQQKKWSEAALGEDNKGRILFIFSSSPYTMHDLINLLLELPLDLDKLMHLEGGPEASIFVLYKDFSLQRSGSYKSEFWEQYNEMPFWSIPNVIGLKKSNR